jgi:hypothetical protein
VRIAENVVVFDHPEKQQKALPLFNVCPVFWLDKLSARKNGVVSSLLSANPIGMSSAISRSAFGYRSMIRTSTSIRRKIAGVFP